MVPLVGNTLTKHIPDHAMLFQIHLKSGMIWFTINNNKIVYKANLPIRRFTNLVYILHDSLIVKTLCGVFLYDYWICTDYICHWTLISQSKTLGLNTTSSKKVFIIASNVSLCVTTDTKWWISTIKSGQRALVIWIYAMEQHVELLNISCYTVYIEKGKKEN